LFNPSSRTAPIPTSCTMAPSVRLLTMIAFGISIAAVLQGCGAGSSPSPAPAPSPAPGPSESCVQVTATVGSAVNKSCDDSVKTATLKTPTVTFEYYVGKSGSIVQASLTFGSPAGDVVFKTKSATDSKKIDDKTTQIKLTLGDTKEQLCIVVAGPLSPMPDAIRLRQDRQCPSCTDKSQFTTQWTLFSLSSPSSVPCPSSSAVTIASETVTPTLSATPPRQTNLGALISAPKKSLVHV